MKQEDDELKRMLSEVSYKAPENPYFKRKVMNRLPDPAFSKAGWVVVIAYVIGAIVLAGYWVAYIKQGIKFTDPMFYVMWATTIAMVLSAIWRPLRIMLR